ncbi:MAG: 50S ribosomal protein L15 [Bacteroidetes bacterium 38_7]|nr:MAG: 50S ribosomal protein L15 [Bacteroidetes bacterium 38_7]HAL64397.1 50S ribosomal protein L15 [Bacteroidales bacterium]
MDLSNLKPAKGSVKTNKRLGRGQGSGRGGTSTRGNKGAQSRSGYKRKIGFEGGQMPLHRRIPKGGFKNFNRIEYTGINLDLLQNLSEKLGIVDFNVETFIDHGLIGKKERVKILGRGQLSNKLNITAHAFSKKAIEVIESMGGTANLIK